MSIFFRFKKSDLMLPALFFVSINSAYASYSTPVVSVIRADGADNLCRRTDATNVTTPLYCIDIKELKDTCFKCQRASDKDQIYSVPSHSNHTRLVCKRPLETMARVCLHL